MNQVVIRPLRFSANVDAMREFLELVGLRSRIESERGGWVDMVAARGMVALHDAASSTTGGRPGQTSLTFEADDIDELKARLEAAGYADVSIWDEAYGRVLSVVAPGGTIWIDERSEDLYGYKLHAAKPDDRWSVTPYVADEKQQAWEQFLEALGTEPLLRFGQSVPESGVRLDLETTEDMDEVRRRVAGAGHQVTRTEEGLEMIDPDGQLMVVHR